MSTINLPIESLEAAKNVLRDVIARGTLVMGGGGSSGIGGATGVSGGNASGGAAGQPLGQTAGSSAVFTVPSISLDDLAAKVLVEALAAAEAAGYRIIVHPPSAS